MSKWIVVVGLGIALVGILFYLLGDKLSWIGNLPGDIRIEKENFKFYFPITTMVIFSLLINVLLRLVNKFM